MIAITKAQEVKNKAEALWKEYDSSDDRELARKIGVSYGGDGANEIKARASAAFREFSISMWGRRSSVPVNDEGEEDPNNRDSLCVRCASVAGKGEPCPWCSRLYERTDWKAHVVVGGSLRVEDCPAFRLWSSARKDRAIVILCLACVFKGDGLLTYWRKCQYSDLLIWEKRYNCILKRLGGKPSDMIELRPFTGTDETWRMCKMGASGKMPSLLAR